MKFRPQTRPGGGISDGPDGSRKILRFGTSEGFDKSPAKGRTHEAVGDGIAATAGLSQELHERDAGVAESFVQGSWSEERHGVDDVEWRPADEELEDDDD